MSAKNRYRPTVKIGISSSAMAVLRELISGQRAPRLTNVAAVMTTARKTRPDAKIEAAIMPTITRAIVNDIGPALAQTLVVSGVRQNSGPIIQFSTAILSNQIAKPPSKPITIKRRISRFGKTRVARGFSTLTDEKSKSFHSSELKSLPLDTIVSFIITLLYHRIDFLAIVFWFSRTSSKSSLRLNLTNLSQMTSCSTIECYSSHAAPRLFALREN